MPKQASSFLINPVAVVPARENQSGECRINVSVDHRYDNIFLHKSKCGIANKYMNKIKRRSEVSNYITITQDYTDLLPLTYSNTKIYFLNMAVLDCGITLFTGADPVHI